MTSRIVAVRGATTIESDSWESIEVRVHELLGEILRRNLIDHDDIVSVLFTATPDITVAFPATAARGIGFGDIPLMCATEIDVAGATPLCIRAMLHVYSTRRRDEIRHVYLHGAQGLRDDLPT
ncbi:MAG: chorismate mutase [Acidobacteria bacterium]|nr:chorismate mutase [Acidobacteriota bacterium]